VKQPKMDRKDNGGSADPANELPGLNPVELPELWQICQLAALVGSRVPEGAATDARREAQSRITLAIAIWREAGLALEKLHATILGKDRFDDDFPLLAGPLKVGKHFMPRLPKWTVKDGAISQEQYLQAVVGMAKTEDRMRWWRAFLKPYLATVHYPINEWLSSLDSDFRFSSPVPEGYSLPEGVFENTLQHQRENGIRAIPDGLDMALAFRRWRLGMELSNKVAEKPHDVGESARRGLEEERGSK